MNIAHILPCALEAELLAAALYLAEHARAIVGMLRLRLAAVVRPC